MYTSAGSDVFAAIRLAMLIYEKWFVKVNRADARYMEFGNDIRFLHSQLKKLGKIFEDASDTLRQDSIRKGRAEQGSISESQQLESERVELIGDFHRTLRDCQRLLEENLKYGNPAGGMVLTARWYGTGIESQAIQLRQRLQFHCTKITFVIQPLQLELLASIDKSVQTLKRQNREQLKILRALSENGVGQGQNASRIVQHGLPPIPCALSERYEHQAFNSRPFDIPEAYPLKESVNALLYHFGQSTVQVAGSFQTPTNDHFNNLLKARWILGKILESPGYRQLGPCLYRATVENIEEGIEAEYERFDDSWDTVQADSLSKLEDEHFSIWVFEGYQQAVPQVTDEAPGEVKILELPLAEPPGYSKQSLLIFRQTDVEFRILRTSIIEGGNHVVPSEKQIVNMHHFRFVPYYAIPGNAGGANSVWICHNQVHQGEIFDLKSIEDALDFQQALTGYEVMYTNSNMKWEIQRDGLTNRSMRAKSWSGIQIWHWKPLARSTQSQTDSDSNDARSRASSSDTRAATLAEEVIGNLPGKAASMISTQKEDLLASTAPKVPVMVIFTYWKGKLSYFHIPIDRETFINLQRCGCKDTKSNCLHTVIEQKPLKKFSMKVHSVGNGFDDNPILADWDLSLFGQPRHPKFQSLETMNDLVRLDCEFDTVEDRKRFQIQLIRTLKAHQKALDDFNSVAKTTRHLDQKPNVLSTGPTRRLSSSTFASTRPSIYGLSPPESPDPRKASVSSNSNSSLRTGSLSMPSITTSSFSGPSELSAVRPIAELPPVYISELEAPLSSPPPPVSASAPRGGGAAPWSPDSYGNPPLDGSEARTTFNRSPIPQMSSTSPPRSSTLFSSMVVSPVSETSEAAAAASSYSFNSPPPGTIHPLSRLMSGGGLASMAEEQEHEHEQDNDEEDYPYSPTTINPLKINKKSNNLGPPNHEQLDSTFQGMRIAASPTRPLSGVSSLDASGTGTGTESTGKNTKRGGGGGGGGGLAREKSRMEGMRKAFFSRRI